MRSRILDHSRGTVFAARTVGVLAVLCWGWYIIAATRTQQFGFSAAVLGVATAFVLPAAILPFIGLRWRAVARGGARRGGYGARSVAGGRGVSSHGGVRLPPSGPGAAARLGCRGSTAAVALRASRHDS